MVNFDVYMLVGGAMLKTLYIDTFSYNDFDTIVTFLLTHNVTILERDKVKMTIMAEVPESLFMRLVEVPLEENLSIGTSPLI